MAVRWVVLHNLWITFYRSISLNKTYYLSTFSSSPSTYKFVRLYLQGFTKNNVPFAERWLDQTVASHCIQSEWPETVVCWSPLCQVEFKVLRLFEAHTQKEFVACWLHVKEHRQRSGFGLFDVEPNQLRTNATTAMRWNHIDPRQF
jgi:hypothetical protein